MKTTNRVGKPWHALHVAEEIEVRNLGVFRSESDARGACPKDFRLLLRDEIRDLAHGRLVFSDVAPHLRLHLAFDCASILELKAQMTVWHAALELYDGRGEKVGRLDEFTRPDSELTEIAEKCIASLSPGLLSSLSAEQIEAVGARFAASRGCSLSEAAKVGKLMASREGSKL